MENDGIPEVSIMEFWYLSAGKRKLCPLNAVADEKRSWS